MIVPFAVWRPVQAHSGPMSAHRGLVLHVQVGSHSCYPEFSNVSNQASSTWWVGKDGTLEQYVDSDYIAWAEAAGNGEWDSVETEGQPSEPLTEAQITTLAKLYAWGHKQYGWPFQITDVTNGTGFGWHGMGGYAWGGHFGCPGDLRRAQRTQILALANPLTDWENLMSFGPEGTRIDVVFLDAGGNILHRWGDVTDWANLQEEQIGRPGVDKAVRIIKDGWTADKSQYVVIVEGTDHKLYLARSVNGKWVGADTFAFTVSAGAVAG